VVNHLRKKIIKDSVIKDVERMLRLIEDIIETKNYILINLKNEEEEY
jgi:hypothetical protein